MLEGTESLLYHRKHRNEGYFFLKVLLQYFAERNDPILSVLSYVAVIALHLALLALKEFVEVSHSINAELL